MDLKQSVKIGNLIEIYGKLLTKKQFTLLKEYYFDNLSLGEIAVNNNISRQAVNYSIKNSLSALYNFENQLKLLEKFDGITDICNQIIENSYEIDLKNKSKNILSIIND